MIKTEMDLQRGKLLCSLKKLSLLLSCICLTYGDINFPESFEDLKEAICGVPQGDFDTLILSNQKVWSYSTTKAEQTAQCLKSSPTDKVSNCEFLLSFCRAYNCSDTDTSLMNTTACITVQEQTGSHTYKLGSFDAKVNQFVNIPGDTETKFLAQFTNGGKYNGTGLNCSLSMDIEFDCNRDLVWQSSTQQKADISSTALTSINFDNTTCKYTLKFSYSGACPPKQPEPPSENLSFGSVLLIIFFVGLAVYFVLGSVLKYCFGSRGKEIIPQSEFWTMLPVYIADGFIFTCTCGRAGGEQDSRYDSI